MDTKTKKDELVQVVVNEGEECTNFMKDRRLNTILNGEIVVSTFLHDLSAVVENCPNNCLYKLGETGARSEQAGVSPFDSRFWEFWTVARKILNF